MMALLLQQCLAGSWAAVVWQSAWQTPGGTGAAVAQTIGIQTGNW